MPFLLFSMAQVINLEHVICLEHTVLLICKLCNSRLLCVKNPVSCVTYTKTVIGFFKNFWPFLFVLSKGTSGWCGHWERSVADSLWARLSFSILRSKSCYFALRKVVLKMDFRLNFAHCTRCPEFCGYCNIFTPSMYEIPPPRLYCKTVNIRRHTTFVLYPCLISVINIRMLFIIVKFIVWPK